MAQTKVETLKGALDRYAKTHPKLDIAKLPAEPPKPTKGGDFPSAFDESKYPVEIRLTDKQTPWLNKAVAGEEAVLLVKVKVDRITSEATDKGAPEVRATLCILEVSKL